MNNEDHYHILIKGEKLIRIDLGAITVSVEKEESEYLEEKTRVVLYFYLMRFQLHF